MGHRAAGLSFLPRFPVRFFIFQLPQLLFQSAVLHIMAGLDFQGPQAGQEKPCQEAAQDDQGQAHRKMPEKELYQNPKKHIEAFIRAFIMYLLIALIDGYILTLL